MWDRYGLLALLVIAVAVMSLLRHDFLSVGTFRNLLSQAAPVAIAAVDAANISIDGDEDEREKQDKTENRKSFR